MDNKFEPYSEYKINHNELHGIAISQWQEYNEMETDEEKDLKIEISKISQESRRAMAALTKEEKRGLLNRGFKMIYGK